MQHQDSVTERHALELSSTRRTALRGIGFAGMATLAALLNGAAVSAQTPPSVPTGAASFLPAWSQGWSTRDAAVAEFFAPDCIFEDLAFETVVHGKSEMRAAGAA